MYGLGAIGRLLLRLHVDLTFMNKFTLQMRLAHASEERRLSFFPPQLTVLLQLVGAIFYSTFV